MKKTTKKVAVTASQVVKKGVRAEPVEYDHDEGKRALDRLAPEIDAIPESEVQAVRVDVQAALLSCLAVAGFVRTPEVYAQFARLPKEHFELGAVDSLGETCIATMASIKAARDAGVLEGEVAIPDEIAQEAAAVEGRMQKVCEYLLSDDPEIRGLLDDLRPGTGYRDLANDLIGYAEIYEARPAVVRRDPKNYRPGDLARAKTLARMIMKAMSKKRSHQERDASATYARCWTLLLKRYEEVRSAGLWLFRKDPAKDKRFPSLFAAGRPNGGRPRKQPVEPGPDAPAPVQ